MSAICRPLASFARSNIGISTFVTLADLNAPAP
jgi:hypothetical protein